MEHSWYERFQQPIGDPEWRFKAACRGDDVNRWHQIDAGVVFKLRVVCEACPVRADCGREAFQQERDLDTVMVHGFRAGFSRSERRRMWHAWRTGTSYPWFPSIN